MNNKKSQAAMDFLMTYGWAILIVLIAIGALAYFGVLSPEKFKASNIYREIGNSCVSSNPESKISQIHCVKNFYDKYDLFSDSEYICSELSEFYCNVFAHIDGIKCSRIILNDISHSFNILSFDSNYCLLDVDFLQCLRGG